MKSFTGVKAVSLCFFFFCIFSAHTAPCPQVQAIFYSPSPYPTVNEHVSTSLLLFTCYDALAGYQFSFAYDPLLLEPDLSVGLNSVTPAPGGYVTAVDVSTTGLIIVKGSDPGAAGTYATAPFLYIHWITRQGGTTTIDWQVDLATAPDGTVYTDILKTNSGEVKILKPGDVNNDGHTNIADALGIARYVAGLDGTLFYRAAADNNRDKMVDIVDALIAAQYSAGLVPSLPLAANPPPIPAEKAVKLTLNFQYDDDNYRSCKLHIGLPYACVEDNSVLIFEKGSVLTLSPVENYLPWATPPRLLYLDHWEGDVDNPVVTSLNRKANVRLDGDRTVTAVFKSRLF